MKRYLYNTDADLNIMVYDVIADIEYVLDKYDDLYFLDISKYKGFHEDIFLLKQLKSGVLPESIQGRRVRFEPLKKFDENNILVATRQLCETPDMKNGTLVASPFMKGLDLDSCTEDVSVLDLSGASRKTLFYSGEDYIQINKLKVDKGIIINFSNTSYYRHIVLNNISDDVLNNIKGLYSSSMVDISFEALNNNRPIQLKEKKSFRLCNVFVETKEFNLVNLESLGDACALTSEIDLKVEKLTNIREWFDIQLDLKYGKTYNTMYDYSYNIIVWLFDLVKKENFVLKTDFEGEDIISLELVDNSFELPDYITTEVYYTGEYKGHTIGIIVDGDFVTVVRKEA